MLQNVTNRGCIIHGMQKHVRKGYKMYMPNSVNATECSAGTTGSYEMICKLIHAATFRNMLFIPLINYLHFVTFRTPV